MNDTQKDILLWFFLIYRVITVIIYQKECSRTVTNFYGSVYCRFRKRFNGEIKLKIENHCRYTCCVRKINIAIKIARESNNSHCLKQKSFVAFLGHVSSILFSLKKKLLLFRAILVSHLILYDVKYDPVFLRRLGGQEITILFNKICSAINYYKVKQN